MSYTIQDVVNIHRSMLSNNIMLFYEGTFSQEIIKSVLKFAESKLEHIETQTSVKKKVFNVMVECLQNICKHVEGDERELDKKSMFMIAKVNGDYIVTTGNPVNNDKVAELSDILIKINEFSTDELKSVFKSLLTDEDAKAHGISGLGLIDVARKTGGKFKFDFKDLDSNYRFFILQTRISY
ncbi:MAG: SiaB family protein kinase [Bacteroidia bacterium]|nr:SiaB family protein kinase [Bacteroidia bacterium]